MHLPNRVALVTGGARRVGQAIVRELAKAGCRLAVHHHRSAAEADALVRELADAGTEAVAIQCDLNDLASPVRIVEAVLAAFGGLDILVNNASLFEMTPQDGSAGEAWERMLRVNTIAPALLARAATEPMRQAGAGRIVNLVDILADRPARGFDAYCASKAALASLTRSLARELAPEITVNGIAPGIAEFPEDYDQALREKLIARVPLGRAGTPEEVAALVRFMVGEADYLTGQIIPLDGGRSIRP